MSNKFWTIHNAVLGTAHINRDGKLVDFRPSKIINVDHSSQIKSPRVHLLSLDGFESKIQVDFRIVESKLDISDWNQQYAGKARATKIVLIFQGQETDPIDVKNFGIYDPSTPPEAVEALRLALKRRQIDTAAERKIANAEKVNIAAKFEEDFNFSALNSQQKKWVKAFASSNGTKAEQQVEQLIKSREGGSEWWALNRTKLVEKLKSSL